MYESNIKQFSPGKIIFGVVCIVFGGTLYFVLPMSIFTFNFFMLMSLLFIVLMGYMAGFILLSMNFHYLIERLFYQQKLSMDCRILKRFFDPNVIFIALKNLFAHRVRNRRASLMYSISISFVIFLWTTVNIIAEHNYYEKLEKFGSDIHLQGENEFIQPVLFEEALKRNEAVQEWSWITKGLHQHLNQKIGSGLIEMKGLSSILQKTVDIFGVQSNLFRVQDQKFWSIVSSEQHWDPINYLYQREGHNSIVIPQQVSSSLAITSQGIAQAIYKDQGIPVRYFFKVGSVVGNFPGFRNMDGKYGEETPCLVSLPTFMKIAGIIAPEQIPLQRLTIKMKAGYESRAVVEEINRILRITGQSDKVIVLTKSEQQTGLEDNKRLVQIVFSGLVTVVMLLSCFSLVATMTANIHDQLKEIAMLKCIGLTSVQISTAYWVEAFILITSSCLVGVVIGSITGLTIANQTAIFKFAAGTVRIPWTLTIVIICLAVVISRFTTRSVLSALLDRTASELLRME